MIKENYWCSTTSPAELNVKAALPRKTNILIIGGGFSGLSTLYHILKENPYEEVILVDEYIPGLFASGRCDGVVSLIGPDELVENNNRILQDLINEEGIACDYMKAGGIYLNKKLDGLDMKVQLAHLLGNVNLNQGFFCPSEFNVNPLKLLTGIASSNLCKKHIITLACVEKITKVKTGFEAHVHKRGKIFAKSIVYCTNTTELIFEENILTKWYAYNVSTSLVTQAYPYSITFENSLDRLRYHDNHAIINGLRDNENKLEFDHIINFMFGHFPDLQGPIGFTWTADLNKTEDGLPICGPIPGRSGEFINVSNELNTVFATGSAIAAILQGEKHPYPFLGMERI